MGRNSAYLCSNGLYQFCVVLPGCFLPFTSYWYQGKKMDLAYRDLHCISVGIHFSEIPGGKLSCGKNHGAKHVQDHIP
jgi:hypothetical protein